MQPLPLRLLPGDDLRRALEAALAAHGASAAFVLAGIGSLEVARLRLASADAPLELDGDVEILTPAARAGATPLIGEGSHPNAGLTRPGAAATMTRSRTLEISMHTPPPNRPIISRVRTPEESQLRAWLTLRRELAELHARLEYLKLLVSLGVRQTRH